MAFNGRFDMDITRQSNNIYRNLIAYRKAVVIYDLTYHFCERFISVGDRTKDQMVQAARSGKQNIVEGKAASLTSDVLLRKHIEKQIARFVDEGGGSESRCQKRVVRKEKKVVFLSFDAIQQSLIAHAIKGVARMSFNATKNKNESQYDRHRR